MSDKKAPPTFIVYLNGARMDPELEGRIKKIAITEKIDHITTVKMEFADAIPHVADNEELTPGSEIKIEMGYLDETDELFNGEITGMKVALRKGSASTCTITAKTHLHRLARIKKSRFYVEMTDTDIIKQIADEACLGADVDDVGTEHAFVTQSNQSDFDFIMEMAERFNCHVCSENKKLFFKQNQGSKSEDVVLEQDKTLITFHATRQTESLITEATVVSWDVDKQEAISGTVTAGDISGNGPQLVQDSFGDRVNVVTNRAAIDNNAAEKLAKDILVRNAREFVRATGESEGNIEIRAGSILRIEAVGQRMSNCYQVVTVQHIIDAAIHGYVTRFELVSNVASDTSDSSSSEDSSSQNDEQQEQAQDEQEEEVASENKSPEITNLQWIDSEGNSITKAHVGDKVKLTADVKDIDDGASIKFLIQEKDNDGENDFIKDGTVKVSGGKLEYEWEVEYHEDTDDTNSAEEQEEKGYTLPEYIFNYKDDQSGAASADSGVLKTYVHFAYKAVDSNGKALKDKAYCLIMADGTKRTGNTDSQGFIIEKEVPGGISEIIL